MEIALELRTSCQLVQGLRREPNEAHADERSGFEGKMGVFDDKA